MFIRPRFRIVPDGTRIQFMKGRFMGLIVSAILSTASVVLFFYPGLNLGIDFSGGIVMEVRTDGPANFTQIREALASAGVPAQGVQRFGDPSEVLVRLGNQASEKATQQTVDKVRAGLQQGVPGAQIMRTDVVGASVSAELFRNGLLALGISLLMILVYIWFRFEWQFAVGAVVTLILDVTKAIGFLALTRIEFDLVMVAAILTILGYSTNDKVVVYDRVRENLRKYKTMPLRELIDLSINETLNRTLGTSMTVFIASLPLALFGGESISGFAWVMLFGIVVGTSSSIFIAAPILLFLGEHRLRREAAPAPVAIAREGGPASPALPAKATAQPAPAASGGTAAARQSDPAATARADSEGLPAEMGRPADGRRAKDMQSGKSKSAGKTRPGRTSR
jgi:preprotein translocase SecF subunit